MTEIHCKKCGGAEYVKSGQVRGLQRYRCKGCGCHFTDTPHRGKPAAMKALAALLYAMGNMSFCGIARLLGVSDVAVLKWIRKEAEQLPAPAMPANVDLVMLDEMHHFLKKRLQNSGSGGPMTLSSGELCPGLWVGVMMQPVKSSSPKSALKAARS